jgi:myo-inositol-1(or 4)-monophosphatase
MLTPDRLDATAAQTHAIAVAEAAGQILTDHFGRVTAHRKDDGTLVTAADHAADQYITAAITATYPNHAILSEERDTHYSPAARYTWVIDPLDGTTNFAHGLPLFGVSIALLQDGLPIVGVLCFPLIHETYHARAGGGAFCNGARLTTDPTALPDSQNFLMQCTRTPRRYTIQSPLKPRILGSAAYHLAAVATGTALAAVEATPKVWDLAAACLIVQEAGGVIRGLSQPRLFPLAPIARDYQIIPMPLVAAANEACLELVLSGMELR